VASVTKPFPPAPLGGEVRADAEGFLTVTPKGIAEDFAQDLSDKEKQLLTADTESHSSGCFRGHNHDRRVEDQAILVGDCEQRSRCSPGASEGRSSGDESYFDHRRLQSRTNAFSPERSRRRDRASCGESREPIAGERPFSP